MVFSKKIFKAFLPLLEGVTVENRGFDL